MTEIDSTFSALQYLGRDLKKSLDVTSSTDIDRELKDLAGSVESVRDSLDRAKKSYEVRTHAVEGHRHTFVFVGKRSAAGAYRAAPGESQRFHQSQTVRAQSEYGQCLCERRYGTTIGGDEGNGSRTRFTDDEHRLIEIIVPSRASYETWTWKHRNCPTSPICSPPYRRGSATSK